MSNFNNCNGFGMNNNSANNNMNNFLINQMNQMNNNAIFNNMNMNNMNNIWPLRRSFSFLPNSPLNFSNFGVCMNPMNNFNINPMINCNTNQLNNNRINQMTNFNMNIMNNMNYMNNNNMNFPFKKSNSETIEQKKNIIDINADITINFRFFNGQGYKVKAKPKEIMKDVVKRFKIEQCPKELKGFLSVCVCHGKKVDQNKFLSELNIKNNDVILFMEIDTEKKDKEENKYELTEREQEQFNKLKTEFEAENLHKEVKKMNLNQNNEGSGNDADNEEESEFEDYLREKDSEIGIVVKEHKHKLVYCMVRSSWKCNICELNYKKEEEKYYCSLCDFSMCKNCHAKGNYFMKKSFPPNTKPSNESVDINFLDTDYHQHRLVYCPSSRHFLCYNRWNCDNCRESFHNNIWSFYCTLCDYDLCCDCCGYH